MDITVTVISLAYRNTANPATGFHSMYLSGPLTGNKIAQRHPLPSFRPPDDFKFVLGPIGLLFRERKART
jgi:hypothetical protein